MAGDTTGAYALHAGEGPTYSFGREWIVKAGERGPGRRLAFVDFTTRRGEEPGPHVHPTEDEIFYVLMGELTFRCGGETFDVRTGGFIYLPQGIEHGYTIRSEGAVHLLVVTFPTSTTPGKGRGGFIADVERQGELLTRPENQTGSGEVQQP